MTYAETPVGRVFPFPARVLEFIDLAQFIVADAEQDDDRRGPIEKVRAERGYAGDLTAQLLEICEGMTADDNRWAMPSILAVAVDSPWYDLSALGGGSLHRRIDAVLDMFDTAWCAHEAQSQVYEYMGELAAAAQSDATRTLKTVGEFGAVGAAGVAGFHGFFNAGGLAAKAIDWIEGQGQTWSELTRDLAVIFLLWSFVPTVDEATFSDEELAVLALCQAESRRAVGALHATSPDARMWRALLRSMGSGAHSGATLPSFAGLNLTEARKVGFGLGLTLHPVDVGRPEGQSRKPLIEQMWRVVGQYPSADTTIDGEWVFVAVLGIGDSVVGNLHRRLEFEYRERTKGYAADPARRK